MNLFKRRQLRETCWDIRESRAKAVLKPIEAIEMPAHDRY